MWQNLKKHWWKWSPNHPYLLGIGLVWLLLVLTNTDKNTWLLSWDLMDSSFAPWLMIRRALFDTWQSFQGLGLLGGHGYAAQLPQAIIQLFLSFFLPTHLLRYAFTYLLLLAGAVGSYFLTKQALPTLKNAQNSEQHIHNAVSATAALAYLLHFGTVQNFYVQLEPFIIMYGLLPWALWQLFRIFKQPTTKNYLIFAVFSFFFSSIGFIPPVFISYVLFLSIICGLYIILERFSRQAVLTALTTAGIVIVTNAYWLTGVAVFTLTQNTDYLNSQLNQMTTQEHIFKNAEYGKINNSIRVRGFLLDSYDQARFEATSGIEPIFTPWLDYFALPPAVLLEYLLAITFFSGLLLLTYRLITTKRIEYSLGILGLLTLCLLTTATPPFSIISQVFRAVPVLNQAFRIPYSKFSMSLVLFYSVGLGFLLHYLTTLLQQQITAKKYQVLRWLLPLATTVLLILYALPSFSGNFIYQGARVTLPTAYTELFSYLRKQPKNKRIAVLPIYTYTGWDMHDWGISDGYTGSGFYWYAIKQPILARSFDVWSPYNENYRNEMVHAVYTRDQALFDQLIEKYQISYFLVDKTVYLPNVPKEDFYLPQSMALIENTNDFQKTIDTGTLVLYEKIQPQAGTVFVPQSYSKIAELPKRVVADPAYAQTGNYIEDTTGNQFIFSQLTTEKLDTVILSDQNLYLSSAVDTTHAETLTIPSLSMKELSFNVFFLQTQDSARLVFEPLLPQLATDKTVLSKVPEIQVPFTEPLPFGQTTSISINGTTFALQPIANQLTPIGTLQLPYGSSIEIFTNEFYFGDSTVFWQPLQNLARTVALPPGTSQVTATIPIQRVYWDMSASNEQSIVNCGLNQNGKITKTFIDEGMVYSVKDRAASCDYIFIDDLPITQGYLVHLKGRNVSGDPLKFVAINSENKYPILAQKVGEGEFDEWFHLLPSSELTGTGYQFLLENQSYGSQETENIVAEFSVYTVPSQYLLQVHTDQIAQKAITPISTSWSSFGSGLILAQLSGTGTEAVPLVLSEAFNTGWKAYDLSNGWQVLEHSKFNHWANAWWVQPGNKTILLVFVPQLLASAATILMLVTLVLLWRKYRNGTNFLWKQPRPSIHDIFTRMMRAARLLLTGHLRK